MDELLRAPKVRQGETIPPSFRGDSFHCVHCVVYASQSWTNPRLQYASMGWQPTPIWKCTCTACHMESWWLARSDDESKSQMLFPVRGHMAPPPHAELPGDVRADYEEAAGIVERSPRGAGALLRLALQKLMPHLGETGGKLNDDIGSLVAKGLDVEVQQALDALCVIGNNAVHPLELNLTDDHQTVVALFGLINYIVEQRITHPKKLAALYQGLPEEARAAIEKRDA